MPDWATTQALLTLIAGLLLGILVAVATLAIVLVARSGNPRSGMDNESLSQALEQIKAAAAHTADIAALSELVEQIKLNPEILLRVDEYGATALAAARLHAIRLLEGDLAHARKILSNKHRSIAYPNRERHQAAIHEAQALVNDIEVKLFAVVHTGT